MSLHPMEQNSTAGPVGETSLKRSDTATSNEDEQNYCRICRGEGTTAQPLYYPCKCSGSIKFVHQECLMEWLSHSQKKYCELCKTSFRFTKLYDRSMPARLPFPLFVRQLVRHGVQETLRWSRYLLVGIIWTCLLPWCIRQVWRAFLWLADGNALGEADSQAALNGVSNATAIVSAGQPAQTLLANITVPAYLERISFVLPPMLISLGDITRVMLGQGLIGRIIGYIIFIFFPHLKHSGHPDAADASTVGGAAMAGRPPSLLSDVDFISAWSASESVNNATIDVLEGQLICVLLVTAFILVFLIREWVINQQPILNMPNPDAADDAPQERQEDNPRPRAARVRAPRRRGAANADAGDREVAIGDPAARPIAVPRVRRALTDDNILNETGNEIERPTLPMRSQSLLANVEDVEESAFDEIGEDITTSSGRVSLPAASQNSDEAEKPADVASGIAPVDSGIAVSSADETQTAEPAEDLLHAQEDQLDDGSKVPSAPIVPVAGFPSYIDETIRQPRDFDDHEPAADSEGLLAPAPDARREELLAPEVSFTDVAQPIDEPTNSPDHLSNPEIATDSDEPVIPTPNSSEDTDLLQPASEVLDADLQEALLEDTAQAGAEEVSAPALEGPLDDHSLLGRIAKWLWHTDAEMEIPAGTNGHDHRHAEAHDEERIVEDVDAEAPFVLIHNRGVPQLPPLPAAAEAPPAPREPNNFLGIDLNDAGDDAEDLDGILELLGMEGPIFGMIQNVIFSLLLITLTLMMSFWFPYMWGKIALLFLSQPTIMLVRAPIFVLSRTADIVVDIIFFVAGLAGFLFNQPMKLIKALVSGVAPTLGSVLDTTMIEGFTLDLSQKSGMRLEKTLTAAVLGLRPDVPNFSMQSHYALILVKTSIRDAVQTMGITLLQLQKLLTIDRPSFRVMLVFLAQALRSAPEQLRRLPQTAQLAIDFIRQTLANLISEPTISAAVLDPALARWNNDDRFLAVILGYALFAVAGIVFLEIAHLFLGLNDNEKVEGYFADSLRQAGGVMKVVVIIGIEMLVFPLYCGLLLDVALLPLFANATVAGRVAFLMRTPLTGMFIHWFIGTCYMFHFALFVSICRKIMRKGVLYFIRDPDDPTFHPVRDVLERPVPAQLGKIAFSALVYGGLVTVCLGSVVWTLDWVGGVLPIQWSTPEPRLAFPIDIVFYNFALPFILRKAEPSKKISVMYKWWFRGCAKSLRLTNFLFGEEQKDEQYTHPKGFPWNYLVIDNVVETQRDGTHVRAPASDSVRIPKGRAVFLDVTEQNERLDGQPDSDFGMHGKTDPQFTKVYLPPNFRSRITTFIVLLWLFAAATGVAFTVGPLLMGRKVTQLMSQSALAPNDLYAFTVGIYIFAAIGYAIAYARPARDYLRAKVNSSGRQIIASISHVLGLAYLGIFTAVVLPFVMSLITELYVHMPVFDMLELVNQEKLKNGSTSGTSSESTNTKAFPSATIFILQSWTVGLLYLRILLRVLTHVTESTSRPARAIRAVTRNGYLQADVPLASRAFVLPATAICFILLLFPLTYMKAIITIFGISDGDKQMRMYRFAYPLFLWMMANYGAALLMRKKVERWRIRIRDEVYLIGERLHNFPEPKMRIGKGKEKEKVL